MTPDPIMRGLLSSRDRDGRIGQAWLMARATLAYTYGAEIPSGRCGFWYSLRCAVGLFIEYITRR